jgi:hypothetical protein
MVPPLDFADDGQDEILGPSRIPGAHGIRGADQDVMIIEARLPPFDVGVSGKPGSMETDNQPVGFRRPVGRWDVEAVLIGPISEHDALVRKWSDRLWTIGTSFPDGALQRRQIVGILLHDLGK